LKTKIQHCLTLALLGLGVSAYADILELKNGNILNGKYAGGTAATLRFETSAGQQVIETSQAIALTFTSRSTQARRAFGKSTLDVRLAQMVLGGSPIPIASSGYKQAGQASIAKAAKGAAAGAAIGAIAGDAGKGAAIGATASLLKKGQTITIPPGTLLEFTLTQPITVPTGNWRLHCL
jgi:hypothetical protein